MTEKIIRTISTRLLRIELPVDKKTLQFYNQQPRNKWVLTRITCIWNFPSKAGPGQCNPATWKQYDCILHCFDIGFYQNIPYPFQHITGAFWAAGSQISNCFQEMESTFCENVRERAGVSPGVEFSSECGFGAEPIWSMQRHEKGTRRQAFYSPGYYHFVTCFLALSVEDEVEEVPEMVVQEIGL